MKSILFEEKNNHLTQKSNDLGTKHSRKYSCLDCCLSTNNYYFAYFKFQ